MSNKIALKVNELNAMTHVQLVEDERVEQKFIQLYNAFHGSEMGEQIYNKEKFNFLKLVQENSELSKCTKLSLYGCFLDVAYNGLSLEQGSKPHAYMLPYNVNTGTKENPKWEKRASLSITGYGELVKRIRAGHIKHADNPVVVYASDEFTIGTGSGGTLVEYKAVRPITNKTIVACFMRMVKNDGSVDFAILEQDDFKRLAEYSKKKNKGVANALYTSNGGQIDKGFLIAKTIKHAFSTYPKIKIGDFSGFQALEVGEDEVKIDYGIQDTEAEEVNGQAFGEQPEDNEEPETVTFESDDEEETF